MAWFLFRFPRPVRGAHHVGAGDLAVAAQVAWHQSPQGWAAVLSGGARDAAPLALAFVDGVDEARLAHGGVDGGGADVGVAGEFADDGGVGAGVGEVRAEGVAQHVRGAAVGVV